MNSFQETAVDSMLAGAVKRRRGWTLIELLVAVALAVVVTAMAAAVFHAVLNGLLRSAAVAARHHDAISAVERVVRDLEGSLSGGDSEISEGLSLRVAPADTDPADGSVLWLWARSAADDSSIGRTSSPVQVCYRLLPDNGEAASAGRRLVRQEWIDAQASPSRRDFPDVVTETVLSAVRSFDVHVMTSNDWVGVWPPASGLNGGRNGPEILRVALATDQDNWDVAIPAVTGFAARVLVGEVFSQQGR